MYRDSNKFQPLDAVSVPIQVVLSVLFAAADELAVMVLTLSHCQRKSELAAAADSGHLEPNSRHLKPVDTMNQMVDILNQIVDILNQLDRFLSHQLNVLCVPYAGLLVEGVCCHQALINEGAAQLYL